MKKLLILSAILVSLSSCVIAQPKVDRAGLSNTVRDGRLWGWKNLIVPVYDDTTTANLSSPNNIGIDSCGAIIQTRSPRAFWRRECYPSKHWVRFLDEESTTQSFVTINIINQVDSSVTIEICTGENSCDTFTYITNVTNATSVFFDTDSSIRVCSVDTVNGGHVQICDTIITGKKGINYIFDNGIGPVPGSGGAIIHHGVNPLKYNTTLNTDYFKYNIFGNPVYDYTLNIKQGQKWSDGTGLSSFWSAGSQVGQPDASNTVRLGVNYTGKNYPSLGTGYFGNETIGYFLNANGTGNGSYGLRADDPASKVTGIIFETLSSTDDGVTIFAAPAPGASTFWNMQPNTGEQYKALTVHTNQDIELLGKTYLNAKRFETALGANVAAANNLTLGTDGNVFTITGNTQINAITTANWQSGSVINLIFTGSPTVKHNTAGGAGTAPLSLAGAVDFSAAANDVLTLVYNGTSWFETSRKQVASSGSGSVTSVGLSMPSAFSVANSPITTSGTLAVTGAGTTNQFIDGTGALQSIGGYFAPNQTSAATTTHDQNYHEFYVNNQGYTQFTAGTGVNQSFAAWDSIQAFFQTNKANFRTIIGTSRNLTSVGGSQVTTYNTSTNKGTALLSYPDSILVATSTTSETTLDYAKPMLKVTRDSMLLKGLTQMYVGRFSTAKGTSTAAANDLTLPNDGNLIPITGNTQINAITTTNWQAGSQIAFVFTGTPTLKNNTAGGAGTATMLLAGRVDYTAAAGDYIAFQYDGTNWYETNRKLAATGGVYTFNNGLTESPAGTVKLGGTLVQNTTVTDAGFTMTFSNNTATQALIGANSSNGVGVNGTSGSGNGVQGSSTSGNGVVGLSFGSAAGVSGTSTSGAGGIFTSSPSSTNTVVDAARLQRTTSGTPANGLGVALDFTLQSSSGNFSANQVISKWTDVTVGTRTSQFIITGVTSATTQDWLTIGQSGYVKFRPMTVTEAGAISTAEGLMVFVSNTDATFTSVGLWIYENSAWHKL